MTPACSRIAFASLATALALAVPDLRAGADGPAAVKGIAYLVRVDGAYEEEASGKVKMEAKGLESEVEFELDDLDALGVYSVYLEDALGSGNFVLFGELVAEDGSSVVDDEFEGEFALKVRSKDGPLPLGAASAEDYSGRLVEVRDEFDDAVMTGMMPDLVKPKGKKGFTKGKGKLERPDPAVDLDAKGRVEIWFKKGDSRQRFRVHAEHLTPDEDYVVEIEDSLGSGVFEEVGLMASGGGGGAGKRQLKLDTKDGDPLPLGVLDVTELEGFAVRIVDSSDAVVLEGLVPELKGNKDP